MKAYSGKVISTEEENKLRGAKQEVERAELHLKAQKKRKKWSGGLFSHKKKAEKRLKKAKEDVLIMHPGPINRGVEISPEVADGPYAIILEQVTNGVAVRMALLYLLISK